MPVSLAATWSEAWQPRPELEKQAFSSKTNSFAKWEEEERAVSKYVFGKVENVIMRIRVNEVKEWCC